MMVCRAALFAALVAAAIFTLSDAKLYPIRPTVPGDEEGMMLPYDRIALDDCHMRYYKDGFEGLVAPAYGNPALLREFAHIAAIGWTQADGTVDFACGGSLIWENYILTAAHCASNDEEVAPDVARMGDLNIYSDEDDKFAQQRNIVKIIRHPQHRYSARYYDVALMKLDKNIVVQETVAPTCLWMDDEVRFPKLFAAGWGKTGFAEGRTNILLKVDLAPMSNANCSRFYTTGERGLRNGLHAHHLCAGDEKMDTCPGDSGGPLHIKLLHNAKMSPFLVGVTSFGKPCGQANPGVYARVSGFTDWIIETLQKEGEEAPAWKFEPWACALRYVHVREYEDDVVVSRSNNYESYNSDNAHLVGGGSRHRVTIQWPTTIQPARRNCSGTLIERDAVATLADCASHLGAKPSRVILSNGNYLEIAETIVHPQYNRAGGQYYNNIAVLKLKGTTSFIPACVWYEPNIPEPEFEVMGQGRADLIPYNRDELVNTFNSETVPLSPRATVRSSAECKLAPQFSSQLARGLQDEHVCFQNKPFLVPGTCDQMLGAPIEREMWRFSRYFNYAYGFNLFGRDCGFGEPAVAVRLAAHKAWLESILLPKGTRSSGSSSSSGGGRDAVIFINPDLQLGDRCNYDGGLQGVCVTQDRCPGIRNTRTTLMLCTTGAVVCCPRADMKQPPTAIEKEFDECEQRYRHLRMQRQERWDGFQPLNQRLSHTVEIGWEEGPEISFRCIGYLISTRGVVTSASCLLSQEFQPGVVRLGGLFRHNRPDVALITVETVEIHPEFNQTTYINNVGLLKLTAPVQPTVTTFPGCVWQNATHTPVLLDLISSGSEAPIFPMYRSDCDARFKNPLTNPVMICMVPGVTGSGEHCYPSGAPIVWRKREENRNLFTEYLVNIYSHGQCNSTSLRLVHRVAMYIDWFKEVLG